MTSTSASPGRNRLILLALWFVFYMTFTLWLPPLLDDADSVHSEVAREMILRHDWVTLYANGIRYLEKAPLLYWSIAASFKLFGVSTASARLPLSFAALALALAVEGFARRAFASARAGLYAGVILLTSFGIFIFTRITIPDVAVCLWLTLAMYAFWLTEQQTEARRWLCWAFAACCALNVLTKGLIGIVFPVGIVLVYLLLTRGFLGLFKRIGELHPGTSLLVFFAISTPWHVLAGLANPTQGHPAPITRVHGHWIVPLPTDGNVHGWTWFYFVNEHLLRYLNLRVPRDYDTVPIALFYGLCFVWLMPWSAYLLPALGRALRHIKNRTNLLLLLWAAIPLLFFSLSTRQEYYVLPALPALMLLVAAWLAHEPAEGRIGTWLAGFMLLIGTAISAVVVYFLLHSATPEPGTDLAELLNQNPGDYALSFGHFLDLNARSLGMFRLPLVLTVVACFGGTYANWRMRRQGRNHAANMALAAGTCAFLLAAHLGLQTFAPVLSSAQMARAIAPELRPGDLIVIHGEYEAGSTLGFYLRRNDIHIWQGRSANLWYGSFFPDAPKIFETTETIRERWAGTQRVFVWQDPGDKDRPLPQLPGAIYRVAAAGGKEILSNQPNRLKDGPEKTNSDIDPDDWDETDIVAMAGVR
ncbi:4-amino-4-deoxy-L-arabinose transferase [Granulicella rosea]|uniref:4-amino-4-deoxy-L-arabinose transferase n=1 Tax=Granulicella rosea TaxID=474952 RepID=A0A239DL72_9BACT|nr:phospholipid carrier-dependent glycosyltransferase [Granulicella rosea]SNS32582.1 4-amino-4-deoxy-L-arabinose transferase [Granulicella rosea]